jgi:hypothetical protein
MATTEPQASQEEILSMSFYEKQKFYASRIKWHKEQFENHPENYLQGQDLDDYIKRSKYELTTNNGQYVLTTEMPNPSALVEINQ